MIAVKYSTRNFIFTVATRKYYYLTIQINSTIKVGQTGTIFLTRYDELVPRLFVSLRHTDAKWGCKGSTKPLIRMSMQLFH